MVVKDTIISQFERVALEQAKKLAPLSNDLVLLDSGLDSLCFAIVVARLEDELGFDPFSGDEEVDFPVTFGDFIRFYEHGAGRG
jgi:acyl carrier protein